MRKSFLLLFLVLAADPATAHVSDAAYCANARGVPNWPYRCFNSLEGAEEWIRQDEGESDGYALLSQAPARAGGHPTAWELGYAVPNGVARSRNHVLSSGQGALKSHAKSGQTGSLYGGMSTFSPRIWIGCGGGMYGSQQGCDSEGAVVEEIQQWYLRTYGERVNPTFWGGYREPSSDQIAGQGRDDSTPPKPVFWVGLTDSRGLNPNGWTGHWGIYKWEWHECDSQFSGASPIDGFGIRQPYPNWCAASAGANISLMKPRQSDACEGDKFGNPCIPATGNKVQSDADFVWNGGSFQRHYSSLRDFPAQAGMGSNWSHSYTGQLLFSSSGAIWYLNEKHLIERFRPNPDGGYDHYASENAPGIVLRADYSTPTRTWIIVEGSERRRFDNWGRLIAIESDQPARDVQLEYCPATVTPNCGVPYALYKVRTAQGRELVFDYADDASIASDLAAGRYGKLIEIRADGQPLVRYDYDSFGRLVGTDYTIADATAGKRRYHYGEADHLCRTAAGTATAECPSHGFPFHLTGITDENGVRYADFTFDDAGRATSTSHAGGADRYTFAYVGGETFVTYPSGKVETLIYNGAPFAKLDQRSSSDGVSTHSHDGFGRRTASVDARGVRTEYVYDSGHRQIARIEAKGTLQQRRIETEWHPLFNAVTERRTRDADGVLVARQASTYNDRGQRLSHSVIDPQTSETRTTIYKYCETVTVDCPLIGLLKSIDGPRTDAADVATYAYYSADAAGCMTSPTTCAYRRGDLRSITDALGHMTEMLAYDSAGRVREQRDPNGVRTEYAYDMRGRLEQRIVRGGDDNSVADDAITRMSYWPNGLVTRITQPDGAYTAYTYDEAQRLTAVSDGLGNTITFTLDDAGNRTHEATTDSGGQLRRQLSRIYDTLNRLRAVADANAAPVAEYTYDANGAVDKTTDALGHVDDLDVDPLGRLVQKIVNLHGGGSERAVTGYGYDSLDRLRTVTDPNGLTTTYAYDGFSDLIGLQSPDTGHTGYTYDAGGNRRTQTDARGVMLVHAYDAANRLMSITPTTPSQAVTFAYDIAGPSCAADERFAAGRLQRMSDASGDTRYCYDRRGNIVRRTQALSDGPTLMIRASYSTADRPMTLTYPSGSVVRYARNAQGQVSAVYAKPVATAAEIVLTDTIAYLPFGPLQSLRYGNGRVLTKAYDRNYLIDRVDDNATSGLALDFAVDVAGNITAFTELQDTTTAARAVTYDGQNRLTALRDGSTLVQAFGYDATGNRTTAMTAGATTSYAYAAGTHRLEGVGSIARGYDAAGSTTSIAYAAPLTMAYDDQGRLGEVRESGTPKMLYRYNGHGERVAKLHPTDPSQSRYFVYADNGRLLGEYTSTGARVAEYVWLEDTLIAVLSDHAGSSYQFIETDHLGTPRAIVHPTRNTIVWRWEMATSAFGEHATKDDPDGDGVGYVFKLRYPGQYIDAESGLHYNHFRDYDASIGRYVQSDPIGLAGGISTYLYAAGAPIAQIDVLGLANSGLTERLPGGNPTTVRIDPPHVPGQQTHAHVCEKGCKEIVVNQDGSGSHGTDPNDLKSKVKKFLRKKGFKLVVCPPLVTDLAMAVFREQCAAGDFTACDIFVRMGGEIEMPVY